jgi:hypothetical protein
MGTHWANSKRTRSPTGESLPLPVLFRPGSANDIDDDKVLDKFTLVYSRLGKSNR